MRQFENRVIVRDITDPEIESVTCGVILLLCKLTLVRQEFDFRFRLVVMDLTIHSWWQIVVWC